MIDRFYQTVKIKGRNVKVLDFEAIRKEGKGVNIILSERGRQGKTFNALEYILNKYKKNGDRAVWIYNTVDQLKINFSRLFLNNKKTYPSRWKGITVNRKGLLDKKGNIWCYFVALSVAHKYKGGRDYTVKTIIYDEFNEGLSKIGANQPKLFESILQTFTDPNDPNPDLVCFVFGNQQTMAVPLLSKLKITNASRELLEGNTYLMYIPKSDKEDIRKIYKNSWVHEFIIDLGLANETIFNENIQDNMNGVVDNDGWQNFQYEFGNIFYTGGAFFQEYFNVAGDLFLKRIDPPYRSANIYCIRKKDLENNIILNIQGSYEYIERISTNRIYYDSFITKRQVLDAIFKW